MASSTSYTKFVVFIPIVTEQNCTFNTIVMIFRFVTQNSTRELEAGIGDIHIPIVVATPRSELMKKFQQP